MTKAKPKCDTCGGQGMDGHTCPFKEEIHENNETCNCCESCTRECQDSI